MPSYRSAQHAAWVGEARQRLIVLKSRAAGWAYKPAGEPSVEPTVLACLALLAIDEGSDSPPPKALVEAVRWVASLQRSDGSVGVSAQLDQPRWPTSHALLLGCQLPELQHFCRQAADYLLGVQGLTWPRRHDDVTGHDTNIPGWPWVDQTHSWVEPTAMAILALQKYGRASHPRVAQGKWMLLDRMIPSGGWNYGNSFVFQQELRPRPAPTGLALLALCGATGIELGPSLDYLERDLPGIRSPQSLCWGLLALKAWGRQIEGTEHWLEESYELVDGYFDPALQLSYLLLAVAGRLHMLGIDPVVKERTA